ncbi:cytochrome c oxidase assembly protein [Virgibacillus indicus]|nr:cytochrome c oxidase assembly protein [Virgibacillus indicus]
MLDILLEEFHFSTMWNGGILLFILFGVIIYLFILPEDKNHKWWRTILFFTGLIILFISIGSPLNVIGRIQFSTHIIQIVLLLLFAPPLLIIGFKKKTMEKILSIPVLAKIMRVITNPIAAIILFYLLFYGYHIPVIFNNARIDLYLNYFYLLALFIAAFLLWIPIISSNRLHQKQKRYYIIANIVLLIPYSLLLLLAKDVLYMIYTDVDMFISALAVCLPDFQDIPKEFFQAIMPFNPAEEQPKGGWILLVSQLVIFGFSLFMTEKNK